MPTDAQIEAAARSDAKFDGRDFDGLRRLERERYKERSRLALEAAAHVTSLTSADPQAKP